MWLFQLFGLILSASPISIYNEYIYFPYSILGFTLYFLTIILDQDSYSISSIIDIVVWFGIGICIILQKPISYNFILSFFLIFHYSVNIMKGSFNINYYLMILGVISSLVGIFIPFITNINFILLVISLILQQYYNKKTLKTKLIIQTQIPDEIYNINIPLNLDSIPQEEDFVIPKK